jgi:hypothetical protein
MAVLLFGPLTLKIWKMRPRLDFVSFQKSLKGPKLIVVALADTRLGTVLLIGTKITQVVRASKHHRTPLQEFDPKKTVDLTGNPPCADLLEIAIFLLIH